MTIPQDFDAYIPVYDSIPPNWEDARRYIVEQLKQMSNAINIREIGWFLEEELLSGKQFSPPSTISGRSDQYRAIFRKVINVSPLVAGINTKGPHGIKFNADFTLIDLWVSGTNSSTLKAVRITGDDVVMNSTDFSITSPMAFNRAYAFVEYIKEI